MRHRILAKDRVFYGWWIVLACAVLHIYSAGTYYYGFTAFFNPIIEEFGWSYALVSLASSFRGLESGIVAPIAGIYVDKLGPRRLIIAGMVTLGVGFLLFGRIHSLWSFYVVVIILGLGLSLSSTVVTMAAVTRWFGNRASLPMGVLTAGFAVGGMLVPVVVWVVDQVGWREATTIFGIGALMLGIPLALVVKDRERESPSPKTEKVSLARDDTLKDLTAQEAIRNKNLWLLSTATFFTAIAGVAVVVHQIPYMVSIGISRQAAGLLASALSLSSIFGRLGCAWLANILDKRFCFAIATLVKGIGVLAFSFASSVEQFVPSVITLGIGFGAIITLRPILQIAFFGTKAFGAIQGILMIFVTLGSMVAPLFAGWVFDTTGSYRQAFLVLAVLTFVAVPMVLVMSTKHKRANAIWCSSLR